MSRTYKTAPFYVNVFKEYNIKLDSSHNCTTGDKECDLPEPNIKAVHQNPDTSCYWSFELIGKNVCGCPLCSQSKERKLERRDARHTAKQDLHRIVKETRFYDELEDEELLEEEITFVDPVPTERWGAGKVPESYSQSVLRKEEEARKDEIFRQREKETLDGLAKEN